MNQGRDELCRCGSGKFYRSCHGLAAASPAPNPADNGARAAALIQRALQLHQSGSLREAHALYTQVLSVDPDNPDAIHFLGYLEYQRGNLESALQSMRRSVELRPRASQYHGNLGIVLMQMQELDEAEAALTRP